MGLKVLVWLLVGIVSLAFCYSSESEDEERSTASSEQRSKSKNANDMFQFYVQRPQRREKLFYSSTEENERRIPLNSAELDDESLLMEQAKYDSMRRVDTPRTLYQTTKPRYRQTRISDSQTTAYTDEPQPYREKKPSKKRELDPFTHHEDSEHHIFFHMGPPDRHTAQYGFSIPQAPSPKNSWVPKPKSDYRSKAHNTQYHFRSTQTIKPIKEEEVVEEEEEKEQQQQWKSQQEQPQWKSQQEQPQWKSQQEQPQWKNQQEQPQWKSQQEQPQWNSQQEQPQWNSQQHQSQWKNQQQQPPWKSQQQPQWKSLQQQPQWKSQPLPKARRKLEKYVAPPEVDKKDLHVASVNSNPVVQNLNLDGKSDENRYYHHDEISTSNFRSPTTTHKKAIVHQRGPTVSWNSNNVSPSDFSTENTFDDFSSDAPKTLTVEDMNYGRDNREQFHEQGRKGQSSYKFGYNTGDRNNPMARYEERDADGIVRGSYSFVDANRKLQVVHYESHPEHGFRTKGSLGYHAGGF